METVKNILIVLNGASSSGKTSIAQELLKLLGAPSIHTGLDDILERTRPFGPENGNPFVRSVRVLLFNATDGRLGLFKKLHDQTVSQFQAGQNVIVEIAWMDKRALIDAAEKFAPLNGFFVGVKPPLEVSERWEAQRRDRPVGQARKHYELIHAHGIYDFLLDPSQMSPRECAQLILKKYGELPHQAFQQILAHQH